jgi:hypothetical protein
VLKAFKAYMKLSMLTFIVLVAGSITGIAHADQNIMRAELSTHSFEGNTERIAFYFEEPIAEALFLEVYEFHYIMFPDLAPEEDTWPHEKQMSFMEDVAAGRAGGYDPQLTDDKVREILNVSPMQTVSLSSLDGKTHYTDWKARHGRIFFRVRSEAEYLEDSVHTMRVHCRHIDMRTVENLKEQLQAIKLPLNHQNSSFAAKLYDDLYTTYTQGHSLRFMLQHHEKETEDVDILFTQLQGSIADTDFDKAEGLVGQIERKITEKEKEFYTMNVHKVKRDIHIEIEDVINDYSFHEDPGVEVYVKEFREPTLQELMTEVHSTKTDHTHMDPSSHAKMLKPDKDRFIKDAVALEKSQRFFTGSLSEEWDAISVIIFYGVDQNYYITNQVTLN